MAKPLSLIHISVCGHLAYSLEEYQKAMLDFAEQSDGNEADRTAEGFAKMFGTYFPPEFSITEGNAWMSTPVSYTHLYSPATTISSYAAYFRNLSRWASKLYPSTCMEVDTLVYR